MSKPSFYCENCGRDVAAGMDTCPGCGQEFDSVLCPSCGFKGASKLFKQNCPNCGYSGFDTDCIQTDMDLCSVEQKKRVKQLPVWFYRVLIGFLVVIIVGLIRLYFLL